MFLLLTPFYSGRYLGICPIPNECPGYSVVIYHQRTARGAWQTRPGSGYPLADPVRDDARERDGGHQWRGRDGQRKEALPALEAKLFCEVGGVVPPSYQRR